MTASAQPPKGYPLMAEADARFGLAEGLEATTLSTGPMVSPDRTQVIHDPRLGDHAIAITWNVGDRVAGGLRSELADRALPPEGVPLWYGLSFLIEEDMPLDPEGFVTIGQFHTPDPDHKPQIGLRYRGTGHFDISLNNVLPAAQVGGTVAPDEDWQALQKKPLRIRDLRRGTWHRIEFLVIWSAGADGLIDIVFNGSHVFRYTGPTTFSDQNGFGPYFKFGVYPSDGNSRPLTVLYARYDRRMQPDAAFLAAQGFLSDAGALEAVTWRDGDGRRSVTDG